MARSCDCLVSLCLDPVLHSADAWRVFCWRVFLPQFFCFSLFVTFLSLYCRQVRNRIQLGFFSVFLGRNSFGRWVGGGCVCVLYWKLCGDFIIIITAGLQCSLTLQYTTLLACFTIWSVAWRQVDCQSCLWLFGKQFDFSHTSSQY